MRKNFLTFLILLFCSPVLAQNTDWMSEAKLGIFTHFLPGDPNSFQLLDTYDVEAVASQMHEIGVKFFVLTLHQNTGFINCPNAVYDQITGYAPGEKCSKRDVPMELADALAKYDIKLVLYATGQVPNLDKRAQRAFGLTPVNDSERPRDLKIDLEFAKKWAKVFECWSDRYGEKIAGWWIDGCYEGCDFNEEILQIYSRALKHGNPRAVIAFNPGVCRPEWLASDWTAGEINEPFVETREGRFTPTGQQIQILTFLGSHWCAPNCRFTTEEWVEWVKDITKGGAAVTIDAQPNYNPSVGPIGILNPEQVNVLKTIRAAL